MTVQPSRTNDISTLKTRIAQAVPHFAAGTRLALLDYPDHDNIGDTAIYSGEMAFLNSLKIRPAYSSTAGNFSQSGMNESIGDGPILMHGGGNFGTLWTWFQEFRERIIETNVGRPIIQLPQTLYYDSQAAIDRTARLIERHGNYTLLVRDQKSFDLATKSFQCEVKLCPDMAFYMGPLERKPAHHAILLHLREDQEAAGSYDTRAIEAERDAIRLDWPREGENFKRGVFAGMLPALAIAGVRGGRQGFRERRYRGLGQHRLRRGIELLSRGEKVVTNRLHGHILCYLMDIPHCVIDNSYGKTSSFMDAWGTGGGNVFRADTVEEAVELLIS